jgi:hypothetical protein
MNFTLLKQWAKEKGYDVLKEKGTEVCIWTLKDDPAVTGMADTLIDTATQIYNHITDNKWLEYQEEYKRTKEINYE